MQFPRRLTLRAREGAASGSRAQEHSSSALAESEGRSGGEQRGGAGSRQNREFGGEKTWTSEAGPDKDK